MSNVALFKQGRTPEYLTSVNTPDYLGNPEAIIDPNIASTTNVPVKYWKRNGDLIEEMSAVEKQAVDQVELDIKKSAADNYNIGIKEALSALIKVINTKLPAGQKITKQEVIDAIKGEIN